MIIHAEERFLAVARAHQERRDREDRLRDKAANVAELRSRGFVAMCTRILQGIPQEDKEEFKKYLQEYNKIYE